MPALIASSAIRGAARRMMSTFAVNGAVARWMVGLTGIAGAPRRDDRARDCDIRAVDDEGSTAVAVRRSDRRSRVVVDRGRLEVDAVEQVRGLRVTYRPPDRDAVLQQPVDEPVRLEHPVVLVGGVHRDDQRSGLERRGRRHRAMSRSEDRKQHEQRRQKDAVGHSESAMTPRRHAAHPRNNSPRRALAQAIADTNPVPGDISGLSTLLAH